MRVDNHTAQTHCRMKFGMETQLDGCQHIAVETQPLMAMHLHIYLFILASKKTCSHSPTHTYSFEFEKKAYPIMKWSAKKDKTSHPLSVNDKI